MKKQLTMKGVKRTVISQDVAPYIIAEIGSNHNQSLDLARELIKISAECGADAVKFQSLQLEKQYHPSYINQNLRELFNQIKLEEEWYPILAEEARNNGVDFFSAPTYMEAVDLLEKVEVPFYKLASPQIRTFPSLVRKVAQQGKPIFLSVGYCNYRQIENAVNICLEEGNNQVVILHCVSEYPTAYEKVNLRNLVTFSHMFDSLVGLSDHTEGSAVPAAAVALGATVIEKHITLDREMKGPDHHFALTPSEFKEMVDAVRNVYKALGTSRKVVTTHEKKFANQILVRWFAKEDIHAGDVISEDKIAWYRSEKGISDEYYHLLGCIKAATFIPAGQPITWESVYRKD